MFLQQQQNFNFSYFPQHHQNPSPASNPQNPSFQFFNRSSVIAPPPPPPLQTPTPPPSAASPTAVVYDSNRKLPDGSSPEQLWALVCTMVDQGLLFFTEKYHHQKALAAQSGNMDSSSKLGLRLNPTLLKIRHESVISVLYTDLPEQCSVCGLRFVCKHKYRVHMEWHIDRNLERLLRCQKNTTTKPFISRAWYAATTRWVGGLDQNNNNKRKTDVASPAATVLDCHNTTDVYDERKVTVPADEDQAVCALCGDRFEDFYCEEAVEWLYKGTV